jgi:hypothetical protein
LQVYTPSYDQILIVFEKKFPIFLKKRSELGV